MVFLRPLFSNLFSFLTILLLHFGCFFFHLHHHQDRDKDDVDRNSLKKKLITTPKKKIFSFFKTLISLSSSSSTSKISISQPLHVVVPSPSSSTRSLHSKNPHQIITPLTYSSQDMTMINTTTHNDHANINKNNTNATTTSHDDIHPCSICGEIFQNPDLLQLHQYTKHAVSELLDGENIVRIIFNMGWPEKLNNNKNPTIHQILKIHNNPRIVSKFEEYREYVKSRAASSALLSSDHHDNKYNYSSSKNVNTTLNLERCIADGNELLRFYCTTFTCELNSNICSQQYCSVCGIIKNGFSPKMDGICMLSTSWKAHVALPEDLEVEFEFMGVKRALLICRVVAGRVGSDLDLVDKKDPGFESMVGQFEDELVVINPRAVLPCFVIVYTV